MILPPSQSTASRTARVPCPPPVLCGADMELGNFIAGLESSHSPTTANLAARLLLRAIPGCPADGRETGVYPASTGSAGGWLAHTDGIASDPSPISQDWGRRFLTNGACAYIDLNHLELCIPEVLDAYDHLAATHSMYRLAQRAAQNVQLKLPRGCRIHVLANNSDGQGNSYGSHLNFLVSRETWNNLFQRRLHYLLFLATYQASSIVLTGLGKVGSENNAPPTTYQISQRADFFEVLSGPQTTANRPIVNSRDEPLCGHWRSAALTGSSPDLLARLHVIFYDHNLCHVAAFLKVGILQIILAMIEQGRVNARLSLEDPVAAVKTWSQDPSLQARVPMVCGRPQTALETQTQFLEAASRFVADGGCEGIVPHAREILQWWSGTLALLEKRAWPTLARRLDWVRKLELLKQAVELRPELTWTSPELKHLDHLYSSLDPQDGLYWACEREGWIEQLVDDTHIARLLHDPPDNTRAWARSALLRLATSDEIDSVGWDRLRFRIQNPARWAPDQYYTVHLPNPLTSMKTEWGPILSGAADLAEALTGLAAQYHRTNAPQAMPQANGRDLAIAAPDTEPTTGISNAAHDTPSPPHSNPENPT